MDNIKRHFQQISVDLKRAPPAILKPKTLLLEKMLPRKVKITHVIGVLYQLDSTLSLQSLS